MKKQQLEQGSSEWYKFRKKHIGASDAPTIMNLNPHTTPYQLWRDKLDLDPPKPTNSAMERGHRLEQIARQRVCEYLGEEFEPAVYESTDFEWMSASLDAISQNGKIVVEIKCPGKEDHLQALNNVVPEKYEHQLQHQMAVCELDFMYYFSFDGTDGKFLKAYRDDQRIKQMIEEEKKFLECIKNLSPPLFTNKDHIEKKTRNWEEYTTELKIINLQRKELEKKEKIIRECLIQEAGNQSCKGNGVTLTKIVIPGKLDYERVIEEKLSGVDLEPYRKNNIETWRIGVN